MPQRVIATGGVPTTTGLPGHADYWPKVQRTVLGPNQTLWSVTVDTETLGIAIPAGAELSVPIYAVPAGFDLYFAAVAGTVSFSHILHGDLYDNGVLFTSNYIDLNFAFTPNTAGMYVFRSGHVFSMTLVNTGDQPVYVRASFSGVLQAV